MMKKKFSCLRGDDGSVLMAMSVKIILIGRKILMFNKLRTLFKINGSFIKNKLSYS